jgi:hypothetical protein
MSSRQFPAASPVHRQPVPSRLRATVFIARVVVIAGLPLGAFAQTGQTTQSAQSAPEQALPTVTVSAAQEIDVGPHLDKPMTRALGSRKQLDTPFSTTVITGDDLAERQVTKLGDVFFTDASVSDNSNANNAWSSYLTVRGLQLDWQNGFKINGMPFVSYGITLPYEQLEQVELLKGASGFMYGFGNPGGTVNYITKKPTDVFTASAELGYRSSHLWSEHVDVGGRAGPDNMFGYRLNLTHEEGKPSNAVGLNRNSVSLGLDARITRDLTWTFDGIYQDRSTFGQTPTFTTYSLPAASCRAWSAAGAACSRPGPALLLQPAVLLHGPALQPQRRLDGQHDLQLQQAVAQPQRVEPEPDRRQRQLHRPALRRCRGTPVQSVDDHGRRPLSYRPVLAPVRRRRDVAKPDQPLQQQPGVAESGPRQPVAAVHRRLLQPGCVQQVPCQRHHAKGAVHERHDPVDRALVGAGRAALHQLRAEQLRDRRHAHHPL